MKKPIKNNLKIKLFLIFPILIVILIFSFEKESYNSEHLVGIWETGNKKDKIRIFFKNNHQIELIFLNSKVKKIIGEYETDFLKHPASISIKKINDLNKSLFSIIEFINEDLIVISKFSTKWRLRPISFLKENIILLNRVKIKKTI